MATKDLHSAQTIYKSVDVFIKDLWVSAQDVTEYIPMESKQRKWIGHSGVSLGCLMLHQISCYCDCQMINVLDALSLSQALSAPI
jgi:hypothetical protein